MPTYTYSLGPTGIVVPTQAQLVAYYTAQFQAIYGADINLASDTPDGQMMNIFIQSVLDVGDFLVQIYNQFDPDNAVGVILDQRVAINGVQRQAGTFTTTDVTIVTSASVNLYGLDQTIQPVYTVSDSAGNQWQLQTTQLGVGAGTHVFVFQAAIPGAVLTVPNTITVPVTVILGVVSVNNPTTYITLGINEESDTLLRIRRQQSVSKSAQGYYNSLKANLLNINGVTVAQIYENFTNTTNGDGVPGHYIWVIVGGSGSSSAIANAIYSQRNAGVGMFGNTTFTITQLDGTLFIVTWDVVVSQDLFIFFTATSINGTASPNIAAIRSGLPSSFTPGLYEEVNINAMATQVQILDSNTLVTQAGFSSGITQTLTLSGVAASGTFKVNYNGHASAAINWNDSISTIQSKTQAVTGLSAATVTGSIASQSLVFNLSLIGGVLALITISNNSLQTVAPAAITFSYNEGNVTTLLPLVKKNQFSVSSANIVILPMILSPAVSTVATAVTIDFVGLGGYGIYTYAFVTNNSSGSINSSTGVYVSGASTGVTDTLSVTDAMGNTATAAVLVV